MLPLLACTLLSMNSCGNKNNDDSVSLDYEINRKDDKAGFWKCPYHNGRMCMEIIERLTGE